MWHGKGELPALPSVAGVATITSEREEAVGQNSNSPCATCVLLIFFVPCLYGVRNWVCGWASCKFDLIFLKCKPFIFQILLKVTIAFHFCWTVIICLQVWFFSSSELESILVWMSHIFGKLFHYNSFICFASDYNVWRETAESSVWAVVCSCCLDPLQLLLSRCPGVKQSTIHVALSERVKVYWANLSHLEMC